MKYVKFIMSTGPDQTLPFAKAKAILESEKQLVMITNEKGEWSGKTINKAHIVSTDIDRDETGRASDSEFKRIDGPKKDPKRIKELLEKNTPEFLKKPYNDN